MTKKAKKQKFRNSIQKELERKIQIIGKIDNEELGFAVKNNLIKWWQLKAWQEWKERK
ncbi:MAG: hypothetical protein ABH850_02130 [Candidatus Micrarchaeota archaeon]